MSFDIVPLEQEHLRDVINLITLHDEDDGESAEYDFQHGLEDHWVGLRNGKAIGISGYRQVPSTDGTGYLSWTYVHPDHTNQRIGRSLLNFVIGESRSSGTKKMFVKVSNYDDGSNVYQYGVKLYESAGFREELTNLDFYDIGEDQVIFGLELDTSFKESVEIKDERPTIRFDGIFNISETEGAYTFSWNVQKNPLFGPRSFTVQDLYTGLRAVHEDGGRIVFLTFPSNLPLIHKPLQEAGFKYVGSLKNYFELGIDEMHFVHRMEE